MNRESKRRVLLELDGIKVQYSIGRWSLTRKGNRVVRAVDGVSLQVLEGETMGLVGESGSGKTTVGRVVAHLVQPTEGHLRFEDEDVTNLRGSALRRHLPKVQMVFQDPFNSLNPYLSIEQIVEEPLRINRRGTSQERRSRVDELLRAVGISESQKDRRPSGLSGGQRQRVAICRALALDPQLVVCDEAVSALDVSIQAKILNLLLDLQQKFNLTYLFISHDLSVVRLVADQVAVMYLGRIVETARASQLFAEPLHPYTQALLKAVPKLHERGELKLIEGEMPSNINPPQGCAFHTRCPQKMEICTRLPPRLAEVSGGREVACFLHHEQVDMVKRPNRAHRRAEADIAT